MLQSEYLVIQALFLDGNKDLNLESLSRRSVSGVVDWPLTNDCPVTFAFPVSIGLTDPSPCPGSEQVESSARSTTLSIQSR